MVLVTYCSALTWGSERKKSPKFWLSPDDRELSKSSKKLLVEVDSDGKSNEAKNSAGKSSKASDWLLLLRVSDSLATKSELPSI